MSPRIWFFRFRASKPQVQRADYIQGFWTFWTLKTQSPQYQYDAEQDGDRDNDTECGFVDHDGKVLMVLLGGSGSGGGGAGRGGGGGGGDDDGGMMTR